MIGFPFDSHVTFESDGTPVYDRAITSAPLRKLIAKLLTDGILPNPSTNLQVEAGSGMNVVVNPGFAICAGGLKLEENQRTLAIQAADSNYDRIDTVVLRWNDNDSERICDLYIVEGIPAASPLRPELTRTESIWELGLADLFINKNSSAISNQRITDTRYETARCGIISAISEFDTTTLYQQVQADLAGFKASEQADFITWFNDIKGQLSEDAAGNLQKQIGTLEALKTEVKNNLVNALNWVVDKTSGVIAKLGSADISKIGDGTVTGAIVNNKEAIEDVTQSLTNKNIATVICRPETTIYDNDSQDLYTEFTCEQNPNDFNLFTAIVSAAYMQTPVYIKEWYSETEDGINISASRTIPVDKHYYNYYYTMITWERNQTAPYKIKVRRAREFFIASTDGVSVEKIGFNGNLPIQCLQGIK